MKQPFPFPIKLIYSRHDHPINDKTFYERM